MPFEGTRSALLRGRSILTAFATSDGPSKGILKQSPTIRQIATPSVRNLCDKIKSMKKIAYIIPGFGESHKKQSGYDKIADMFEKKRHKTDSR